MNTVVKTIRTFELHQHDTRKDDIVFFFLMPSTVLLGSEGTKLWSGLILDQEHGWKWSNGKPYRYMKWDSGRLFSPLQL